MWDFFLQNIEIFTYGILNFLLYQFTLCYCAIFAKVIHFHKSRMLSQICENTYRYKHIAIYSGR